MAIFTSYSSSEPQVPHCCGHILHPSGWLWSTTMKFSVPQLMYGSIRMISTPITYVHTPSTPLFTSYGSCEPHFHHCCGHILHPSGWLWSTTLKFSVPQLMYGSIRMILTPITYVHTPSTPLFTSYGSCEPHFHHCFHHICRPTDW